MKNMKTNSEDIKPLAPRAEGSTNVGEVKSEFTFLWTEADEWKPAKEMQEIMEHTERPIHLTGKIQIPKENLTYD